MTDIIAEFMDRLRCEWTDVPVIAHHQVQNQKSIMGVAIQRWVQRPEGCEVTVNITYYPDETMPMKSMLSWLEDFHTLIRKHAPKDVFTQWWGQQAQFSTDPMCVTCSVMLRQSNEVV